MPKTLILAEKPSVARDIARVLHCDQKRKGYIEGGRFVITWALGHLVTLAEPEAYGDEYKTWKLEYLPMLPVKMKLVVIKQTRQQYSIIKKLLARNDISELVIATDSGREGELVARWIIIKAGYRKTIKRLWISSQTDKAIREGFSSLRPSREYDSLYMSAQSRAEADWLIGLNVTRALTCKYNAQLSAGRVQTPTLAMIVAREEEIRKFIPRDYWTITAGFKGLGLIWQDRKSGQTHIFDRECAESIVSRVNRKPGKVIQLKKQSKSELQPLAYDLTELQRDANRIYGFSAKQTSLIMQGLYEHHKAVTYPRTDSRYITDDIVPTLEERLKSINIHEYGRLIRDLLKKGINVTKRFVDNSRVSDHHAIIPTEQMVDHSALSPEESRIYDLIVKRFLAVLYPPCEYEETSVKVESEGEIFSAKGRIIQKLGWKTVYKDYDNDQADYENSNSLSVIKPGQTDIMNSVKAVNHKTKPPARYNEATLLSAMENPARFIDDSELKKTIEKVSGLGTPATRADIIEKLYNSFYIENRNKDIYPTSKGVQLIDLVPGDLKSPELTAKWEQELLSISRGAAKPEVFIDGMKVYATSLVKEIITSKNVYKHDNITQEKCRCGKFLLEVHGKKGKMLVCSDRECGYRKVISQISNSRCPECHKRLEIKGDGDNRIFTCNCGYREKMSDFKKRKSEKVSRREVSRYLKDQKSREALNTPFADAFSKLKDKK